MITRILTVAALFAVTLPVAAASGDAAVGKKKSAPCVVCHGENGVSPSPEFPDLAGQHADYLEAAIKHYQNGKRKNPIMQAQVTKLTPKDIVDLSAYYASQRGLQLKH